VPPMSEYELANGNERDNLVLARFLPSVAINNLTLHASPHTQKRQTSNIWNRVCIEREGVVRENYPPQ